jgi:hypothetical protein
LSEANSRTCPNCGYRRDPGNRRTSTSVVHPFSRKAPRNTSIPSVECPIVIIRNSQTYILHLISSLPQPLLYCLIVVASSLLLIAVASAIVVGAPLFVIP